MTNPASKFLRHQKGSYLLESLIAILIFSFGILGLIGLLSSSIRITNDARYRAEAANLASAIRVWLFERRSGGS